jgi:hypothetical protein
MAIFSPGTNNTIGSGATSSVAERDECIGGVKRVASQAPNVISHIVDPDAPKNTDAVIARGRLSLGRYRE